MEMSDSSDAGTSLSEWSFLSNSENKSGSDFADTLSDTFSMSSENSLSDDVHSHNDVSCDVEKGHFSDAIESEKTANSNYEASEED